MKIVNKKNIYILLLFVICLLLLVVVPTYAKFASDYITGNDIVGFSLNFDVNITNIEEYEQFEVPAGGTYKFNVKVSNNDINPIYYGIWYRMVNPSEKTSNILIGRLKGTDVTTSGSIDANGDITATIVVINNSSSKIIIDVGVASSTTSTSNIEYLGGRYLVKGEVEIVNYDIFISSIKIDNVSSDSLPTSGLYDMTYTCSKGSELDWEPYSKSLIYSATSYVGDTCSLEFTANADYKYLYEMPVGSYVAYEGIGGTLASEDGTTTETVSCKNITDGSYSSSDTPEDETEAPQSCLGQNAREDIDENGNTYGYCYTKKYKYYTKGWRIAYIDNTNNKAVIVSAGSPECNSRTREAVNAHYIKTANAKALKYCNPNYVDGDENGNKCTCLGVDSDSDGVYDQCSATSVDAWAISDKDFYNITKAISGVGKRLTSGSSSLGDSGGTLGSILYCYSKYSYQECGYNNDLIDNGGYYWFAAQNSSSSTYGVGWYPGSSYVSYDSDTSAFGLRPVISLSSSVYVTGGNGTLDDPYTIDISN